MLKAVVLVTGLSLVARSYAQDSGEKSRQIDWTEILMGRHESIGTSAVTGNPTSDRERHTDKSASENKRPVAPTRSRSSVITGLSATTDIPHLQYRKQADVSAEEWKRSVAPPKIGSSAITGDPAPSAGVSKKQTDKPAGERKESSALAKIGSSAVTGDLTPSAGDKKKQADQSAEEWKQLYTMELTASAGDNKKQADKPAGERKESSAPPKIGLSAITGDPAPSAGDKQKQANKSPEDEKGDTSAIGISMQMISAFTGDPTTSASDSKKRADHSAEERKGSTAPCKTGSSAVTGHPAPCTGVSKKQADKPAGERKESSAPDKIGFVTVELTPSAGDKTKQADKSVRDWIVHDNKMQADKSAGFLSKYMYQWQQSDIAKAHTKIAEKLESYSSMPIGVCLIFLTLLTCVAVAGLRARRWFQAPGISSSIEVVQTGCPSAKSSTSTKV